MDELSKYYTVQLKDFLYKYKVREGYYEVPIEIFAFRKSVTLEQMKYQIENLMGRAFEQKFEVFVSTSYNYSKIIIREIKRMRKCFYVEFPYMEREKYEDLFVKLQKVLSEGMLAIAVNNIPNYAESVFIVECEDENESEIIKNLIKEFGLNNRVDRGWDEIIIELYARKWTAMTIPIDFKEDEIRLIFRNLFSLPSNKELKEKGYKFDVIKKRKQVFISYSHNDKKIVREFADDLRDLGINAFIDYRSIDYGENILDSIMYGMEESDLNIIFISNSYKESSYGKTEMLNAWDKIIRKKAKWIIVKLDNVDPNEIKPGLGSYKYFEWKDNSEELVEVIIEKLKLL